MWTAKNRGRYDRSKLRYPSDLTDDEWAHVEPLIPPAKRGGNKRHVEVREVMNGTFKKRWRRSCLRSKLKSSSAPIGREDSWCFHAVGSSNAPLLGSTAAEGLPRIGRTSIATRWRSCGLPQSASCSENFVIPPDVFGQTLIRKTLT